MEDLDYDQSYIGKNDLNWRTHIFQRGWNHQPEYVDEGLNMCWFKICVTEDYYFDKETLCNIFWAFGIDKVIFSTLRSTMTLWSILFVDDDESIIRVKPLILSPYYWNTAPNIPMKNPTVIFVLRKTISILIKYVIKIYRKHIAKNWISKLSTDIPMKKPNTNNNKTRFQIWLNSFLESI